jgi:hypothetical protein
VVAAAVAGRAAIARADQVGVAVLADAHPPVPAERVARAIAVAAALTGDRTVDEPVAHARAAIASGAVPRAELARFARVAEVVAEGWRAYQQVAPDFAAARLAAARRDAEALLAWDGGIEVYADASLRLGAVLDQLGRHDLSIDAFRLAADLDPDRAITTAEFSPDVVAAFDAARTAPAARARVTITVPDAGELGAAIELDGKPAGASPITAELAVGGHVVVARAAGRIARGQAFAVTSAGAAVVVELDAAPAPAPLVIGARGEPAVAAIGVAGEYGELDGLVAVGVVVRAGAPALIGQWCGVAPVQCTEVVEVPAADLAVAADGLWRALRDRRARADRPPLVASDARLTGRAGRGGCRLCRNKWVWLGVGAGVVAGAVVTGALISGGAGRPTVVIDPGAFVP